MATITTTLVQDSFTSAHFSVVSGVNADPPVYSKYDIRVVPMTQSTIGADGSATSYKLSDFTLTAAPTIFLIPTTNTMQSGLYKATLRLYTGTNSSDYTVAYTSVGVFYYDTRTFTVDPIQVASNNSSNVVHKLSHSTPVVKVGGVALGSSDPFYSYVNLDSVNLSCTNVEPSGAAFAADDEYNLGEQTYSAGTPHDWDITTADLPMDAAYECWGYISLDNSAAVVAMDADYVKPLHTFVLDFVADDTTVGYHLDLPAVTLALGDVVGTVSENPIALTISNFAEYADYPFDSIELNIRATSDVTTAVLFTGTKTFSDFAGTPTVNFAASELTGHVNGADTTSPIVNLINGVNYFFETVLKFTNSALFTPVQQRTVVTSGEFSDRIVPVTVASVVNSWTMDNTQGDGLVVSFKKTEQFMGTSEASYNLDKHGVTTVLVEYNVVNPDNGATTTWAPLSGGSIAQGSVTYSPPSGVIPTIVTHRDGIITFRFGSPHGYNSGDTIVYSGATSDLSSFNGTYTILSSDLTNDQFSVATNIGGPTIYSYVLTSGTFDIGSVRPLNSTGVYTVPKNPTSVSLGPGQDNVNIYAEIPGQANYNLVAVRLTLTTDNAEFAVDKRISTEYAVPAPDGYTYTFTASVRYFPAHADHDFTTDVPVISGIVSDVVAFSVPVSVEPYFKAVVTSNGVGADFGSAAEYEYDGTLPTIDSHDVTGLSYPVSYTGATFAVSVQYVYFENTSITTVSQSKTIQQQGLLPITEASVVNSWIMNDTEGAGLVVSFAKTDQFMGTNDATYNLDEHGVTTVLVEYSVVNPDNGATTTWSPLSGGSITDYASTNYTLDAANTNGVYVVPKSGDTGNFGTSVRIYAEIPDQTDSNLVAVRLSLSTNSAAYAPLITNLNPKQAPLQVSDTFVAPAPTGYTYPFTASVRFFPAHADHDFDTDVPVITGIVSGVVAFSVPVSVEPYFKAVVTSNGVGADFGSAAEYEYDGTLPTIDSHDVTGLSYPVSYTLPSSTSPAATFNVSVQYVYLENAGITTESQDQTVQQQGLSPITEASVVNSWTMDNTEGAGLVVSFNKTDQFMGTNDATYNLDATGNQATVLVEYNVLDDTTTWEPLIGGSIAQGSVTYALDATNTTGVYAVPQLTSGALIGDEQAPVFIYAVIPGQADYNLVVVRLTLRTESAAYAPQITNLSPEQAPIQVSDAFSAPAPAGYTYPVGYASVRFFPAPADHDFDTYKPLSQLSGLADSIDQINFTVPVNVPRYFRSSVTTSGGTVTGTATIVGDDDSSVDNGVAGLSYAPTDNTSFELTVSYYYSENDEVTSAPQSMTVQMQGFPNTTDQGFTIASASWNNATQELEYELAITATATSAVRVDGWNVYSADDSAYSAYTPHGNVLRSTGLTQSLALSYADYSTIDVKVVATRSKYLSSTETTEQTQTNTNDADEVGMRSTQITILPGTLPNPTASDIALTNIVYDENAGGLQYASLAVTVPASADGVRITNAADSSTSTSNTLAILITSTPTAKTFTIEYKYDSIVTGSATTAYSAPTTVSFTTGKSNASDPVITSKAYVDASTFTVAYTSTDSSYTSGANMVLTSTVEALPVGSSADPTNLGPNEGSVNLISFKGLHVIMYIRNSFAYSYTVGAGVASGTQVVLNYPITFYVAANPAIVQSSVAVSAAYNTVTFPVNHNGDPHFNLVLTVITQDSSTAEGNGGMYALALFSASGGFEVGTTYTNAISGGAAHTLTVTTITGTGYDTVTSFSFQSATTITTADANVVLYVANTIEGADSFATNVTPTVPRVLIPTSIQLSGNGVCSFDFYPNTPGVNVGNTFVYSGSTGGLAPLNGTYTVVSTYSYGISVLSSIRGQTIWNSFYPDENIGIVTIGG